MSEEQNNSLQKEVGKSPGGSAMYEYADLERTGLRPPSAVGTYAEDIEAHFAQLFPGRKSHVMHELISDLVHIDVHIMHPTKEKPFYVAFTTGMSDLPMTLPEEIREEHSHLARSELFMMLPDTWNPGDVGDISTKIPDEHYWPIHMLKFLARFPHEYKTWLGWGHTIPNGPDYVPFVDGSEMGGTVLLEFDENFSPLKAGDGTPIHLYLAMPAYKEEIEYKLQHGMSALDDLFSENNLPVVVDMFRPNYCQDKV